MEYLNDFQSGFIDDPDIMALSTELVGIQAAYSLTLEKAEDLNAQIRDCEFRLNYFDASMAEGRRIATEVLRGAELRVENITAGSNRLIIPQQKLIARIENEISELSQMLDALTSAAENPVPDKSEPATDNIEILSGFPHKKMAAETSFYNTTDIIPSDQPLQSDHDTDTFVGADIIRPDQSNSDIQLRDSAAIPVNPSELTVEESPAILTAEAQPAELPVEESVPEIMEAPAVSSTLPLKVSLQQRSDDKNTQAAPEESTEPAFKIKLPNRSVEDVEVKAVKAEAVPSEEPPVSREHLPEKPEVLPEETDKTLLHLDVSLRFSFYDDEVQKPEALRTHEWLVKMLIKIPEDNYEFVRYGKGPQDIKSALLRYDNAVLNDMYPFDIITPSRPNIGMYFFNSLEDNVSFMNLRLREISIWENQILLMRINHRNKVLDELLQSGDDILENLRDKFYNQ